ncbi:MAG: hypothetical protein ABEJ78_01100 [Haloferacaceae archaeon]
MGSAIPDEGSGTTAGDSVTRYQFTFAHDAVRDYSNGDLLDAIGEEGSADAVLFGATRAAVAKLVDAVALVESRLSGPDVAAECLASVRKRAHESS